MKTAPIPSLEQILVRLLISRQVLFSLVIALIILAASYLSGQSNLEKQQQSADLLSQQVGSYFESASRVLNVLAHMDPGQEELDAVEQAYTLFDVLYIIDKNGQLRFTSPQDTQHRQGMDMSAQPYFNSTLSGSTISSTFISSRTGSPTVYMGILLKSGSGMVVGELNLTGLQEGIDRANMLPGSVFFIIDKTGDLIAHPETERVLRRENLNFLGIPERWRAGQERQTYYLDGRWMSGIVSNIRQTGWLAVTQSPVIVFYSSFFLPAISGLLLASLLFLISLWQEKATIARQVIAPLQALGEETRRLAVGDYAAADPLTTQVAFLEVAGLASSFDRMRQAVQSREKALQESETQLRLITENMTDLICLHGPDTTYLYVSPSVKMMLGYSPEEMLGTTPYDYFHPEDQEKVLKPSHDQAVSAGQPGLATYRFRCKDNTYIWLESTVNPILGENGKVSFIQTASRDISERKEVEQELLEYQKAIDTSKDLITGIDRSYTYLFANRAFYAYRQTERKNVVGKTAAEVLGQAVFEGGVKHWLDLCFEGQDVEFRMAFDYPILGRRELEVAYNPVRDEMGSVVSAVAIIRDVTERIRKEESLRESEERFRSVVSAMDEGLILVGSDGRPLDCNAAAERILGWTRDEILGWDPLRHPLPARSENGEMVQSQDNPAMVALRTGLPIQNVMLEVIHDNQESTWIKNNTVPLFKPGSREPFMVVSTLTDITPIKLAEDKFSKAFNANGILMTISTLHEGRYIDVNEACCQLLGYQKNEIVGQLSSEMNFFVDMQQRREIVDQVNANLPVRNLHARIRTRSGQILDGLFSADLIQLEGAPHLLISMVDITQRILAEQETLLFRTIVESAKEAISVSDAASCLVYTNPAHEQLFGRPFSEAISLSSVDVLPPESADLFNTQIAPALAGGGSWQGILDVYHASGRRFPVWQQVGSIVDAAGHVLYTYGFMHDDSLRIQAEEELRAAKVGAEAANQAKSRFLATMSHEIRTPLNAILGFTELLGGLIQDPAQQGYLEPIQSSGEALLDLINDLLDLSKIEAGKMTIQNEPLSMRRVLSEIHQIFSLRASQKSLELVFDIDPGLPDTLILDEVRLRQVLFNLVGNAVKFTEQGQIRLWIFASAVDSANGILDLLIQIEDTGIGIPAEQQGLVFDAFHQSDGQLTRKYGGTGLGLAICKNLVEMMGGSISLSSQPGQGSTFVVCLKNVAVVGSGPFQPIALDQPVDLSGLRASILIVDNVASNRRLLNALFKDTQVVIFEAADGQEALKAAHKHHPDLVLMDLMMPVMDGFEATRRMHAAADLKDIPVMAVSASMFNHKEDATIFDGYIKKPVSKTALFKEVARILRYPIPGVKWDSVLSALGTAAGAEAPLPPGVMETLQREFMPQWEQFRVIQPLKPVRRFGEMLLALAQTCACVRLEAYAASLVAAVDNLDITSIRTYLHEFPDILANLSAPEGSR